MRSEAHLCFLIAFLLSLALLATGGPRPAASPFIAAVEDPARDNHVRSTPAGKAESDGHAVAARVRTRSLGFQHFLEIGEGWNMYYSSWPSVVLPIQPTAWALTNMYASIMIEARGRWARLPPQHGFTFTYGGISILMHCPQKPIPWLVVGNFAENLLHITERGWTGVYQVMLSQAETDVSIGVSLSMLA